MKYIITKIERRHIDSINKDVANCTLEDIQGNAYPKQVSIWADFPKFAELVGGSEVEGEIKENAKGYASIYAPKVENGRKPNMERVMEKKAGLIGEAQANKAKQISEAQDRSAWMWAKTNASTLLANQKPAAMEIRDLDEIASMVIELATKIYNGEPTDPFN